MNIVLAVFDSLRADRLSCLGYSRPTTPMMDQLAHGGVLFERAFTPVTPTRPACATILSGQHPLTHGIIGKRFPRRPSRRMASLAQAMASSGYETVVVDSLVRRRCSPWLRRGFDVQLDLSETGRNTTAFMVNDVIEGWLEQRRAQKSGKHRGKKRPFFLFVRYGDTHTPYLPPKPYRRMFYDDDPTLRNPGSLDGFYESPAREYFMDDWVRPLLAEWEGAQGARLEDIDFFRAMYDSEARVSDDGLRQLRELLDSHGELSQTVFALTADHGESLGEHQAYFGHTRLHDPVLHVPWIVHGPGVRRGRRVSHRVETTDIAPTLVDLVGARPLPYADGRSQLYELNGSGDRASERDLLVCEGTFLGAWALRTERHKVIVSRRNGRKPEVYDLAQDTGEDRNLWNEDRRGSEALVQELENSLQSQLVRRGHREDPVSRGIDSIHCPRERRSRFRRIRRKIHEAKKRWRAG